MFSRSLIFSTVLIFAACTGSESNGQSAGVTDGAPVAQGAANTEFQPAFADQTRAPENVSNVRVVTQEMARLVRPWAIAFMPNGHALVTERPGRLRVVTNSGQVSDPIAGLPEVDARGQGGLLDVAVSPSFANDRLIYWSYAEPRQGGNGTAVARGRLSDNATRVENVQVIFRQMPTWDSRGHFGSRLVFDREGRLYITLGDRQQDEPRELAQDLSTHMGKIIRINADGAVPADNPFVGRANARPEIWSYGHRNIQGADLHPETGVLWEAEHGPQGGDEVNVAQATRNYGWPVITYGEEYNGRPVNGGIAVREGMEQPLYYWDPVIAPGGIAFYRGDLFPWRGDLLLTSLKNEGLVRLELDGERVVGEERFDLGIGDLRDVAEAPDGSLWIATDSDDGRIIRLTPAS